jgi:hypothetical protein
VIMLWPSLTSVKVRMTRMNVANPKKTLSSSNPFNEWLLLCLCKWCKKQISQCREAEFC